MVDRCPLLARCMPFWAGLDDGCIDKDPRICDLFVNLLLDYCKKNAFQNAKQPFKNDCSVCSYQRFCTEAGKGRKWKRKPRLWKKKAAERGRLWRDPAIVDDELELER